MSLKNKKVKEGGTKTKKIDFQKPHFFGRTELKVKMETTYVIENHLTGEAVELKETEIVQAQEFISKNMSLKTAGGKIDYDGTKLNPGAIALAMPSNFDFHASETGAVYFASAVSNSKYQPHKRAKTDNKIKQRIAKDNSIERLRKIYEQRQQAKQQQTK